MTAVRVFSAGTVHSERLFGKKMYVSLYYIVFMYWRHWRDDVCADALLKHFSCIILCRLAFGCLQ